MTLELGINELVNAASHALGASIGKTCANYDSSYSVFTKLYYLCVVSILDYAGGAWCTGGSHEKMNSIQHRANQIFLQSATHHSDSSTNRGHGLDCWYG